MTVLSMPWDPGFFLLKWVSIPQEIAKFSAKEVWILTELQSSKQKTSLERKKRRTHIWVAWHYPRQNTECCISSEDKLAEVSVVNEICIWSLGTAVWCSRAQAALRKALVPSASSYKQFCWEVSQAGACVDRVLRLPDPAMLKGRWVLP